MIHLTHLRAEGFKQLRGVDLTFPERFCALVEGANEAGKSTLFEAIYFALYGQGLALRGGGRGQISSLIHHQGTGAEVHLGLRVNGEQLNITRKITRRGTKAEVVITAPDGEEKVSGTAKVNKEVLARLNELDGDALLSSCFVQQKKLGHLEELGRTERQNLLLKLLDMERLAKLKNCFRWGAEEERALAVARGKLRLAETVKESANFQAQLRQVERRLTLAEIHAALEASEAQAAEARAGRHREAAHREEAERLAALIFQVEALDRVLDLLEKISGARRDLAAREDDCAKVVAELENIAALEREELPALRSELGEVEELASRIGRIAALERERQETLARAGRLKGIVETERSLSEPREEVARLEEERKAVAQKAVRAREIFETAKLHESVRSEVARLDSEIRQRGERKQRLAEALARADALTGPRAEIERLSGEYGEAKSAATAARRNLEAAERANSLRGESGHLSSVIGRAAERQSRLDRLEKQRGRIEELRRAAESANGRFAEARAELDATTEAHTRARQSQALRRWAAARHAADECARVDDTLAGLRAQIETTRALRSQAEEKERVGQRHFMYGLGLTAAGVALLVISVFIAWWLIAAGFVVSVAGALISARAKRKTDRAASERRAAEEIASQTEREIHGEEVRRETLAQQSPLNLGDARRALLELEVQEPASAEEAERRGEALRVGVEQDAFATVERCREGARQAEQDAFAAREQWRVESESFERELEREALTGAEELPAAISAARKEQQEAERERITMLEEINALIGALPFGASVDEFKEELLAREGEERRIELDLAGRQSALDSEEKHINAALENDGAASAEEARNVVARLDEELDELRLRRRESDAEAERLAAGLPEGQTLREIETQFNDANDALRGIEVGVAERRARIDAEEGRIRAMLDEEGAPGIEAAERAASELETAVRDLDAGISEAWRADVDSLSRLGAPLETSGARDVLTRVRAELDAKIVNARERIAKRPDYEADHTRISREIEHHQRRIEEWRREVVGAARSARLDVDSSASDFGPSVESQLHEAAASLRRRHDLDAVKERRQRALESCASEKAKAVEAERRARERAEDVRALLRRLEVDEPETFERESIAGRLSDFYEVTSSDGPALRANRDELNARLIALEREASALEDELSVARRELDYDECRLKVGEADRRRTVCDYAGPVLESVRENILRAVLPGTIEHMRAMLPLLTCYRYHDCELDDETYKIRVWDARAGDYVEKEIFSGATQDQFSLALRLAFALATLPQGLGARPKFIFLDEPTAGFDGERRAAFVKLLKEGELATRFDQIFLISPEGIFDANPLPHYVRLSSGKIVEENVSGAAAQCVVQ